MERNEFCAIAERIKRGESADWTRRIDGREVVRRFVPRERLILLGGGHVALALSRMAEMLDFAVTVVDDRPDFANYTRFPAAERVVCDAFVPSIASLAIRAGDYVCILTRGHRWDGECLRALLAGTEPSYLGMIGSRRRVAGLFDALRADGFDAERIARIHAPIGLAIGSQTPEEIAVSIAAQLIAFRAQKRKEKESLQR